MKRMKLNKIFFLISYSIFLLLIMYSNVEAIQSCSKYLQLIAYIFLLLIFIINSKKSVNIKSLLKSVIMILICIITFMQGLQSNRNDYYFIDLILLMIAEKNIKFDDIIKFDFYYKFINIIFIVLLAKIGFIDNLTFYRDGIVRYSYGFSHPNVLSALLTICTIDLIYLSTKNKKYNIPAIILTIISLYIVTFVTQSRSSFLMLILVVIFYFLVRKKTGEKIVSFFKYLIYILFPLNCILSLYITYLYYINNHIGVELDRLLSGRLFYNSIYLTYHNINLFGNSLYFTGISAKNYYGRYTMILDNSYVYTLLRFGVISIIFLSILFFLECKKLYSKKKYFLILILVSFLIYGLFERHSLIVFYNPFLLLFGNIIHKENNDIKEME